MEVAAHVDVIGRQEELESLDDFLESLRASPAGLALVGDAGVGKTTLWRAGADAARNLGYRVLETRPAAAEARLAFAGLGDLLGDGLDELLGELPSPQADALRVALLLEQPQGSPPDERAVAVAFLNALRVYAADGPLLLAVDDIQWLDSASAAVLGYAWRRLRKEPAGLLVTQRSGEGAPAPVIEREGTERLEVAPLSLGAVHALLQARIGLVLPRPVLRRLHEVAGGNAFYALELGRALQRTGSTPAPGAPLPVPQELRELVRDRLVGLPAPTLEALAPVAALSQPTLSLLQQAGYEPDALRPALDVHILEVDGQSLRFAHPLLASAAYERLDALRRRELHGHLAAVVADEEERSRHLALAVEGRDADVAAALERAAVHARARGASASAAELAEQSRRLTPSDAQADVHRRTVAAALYCFDAGIPERATELLEEALAAAPPGNARAEVLAALSRLHRFGGDQPLAAEFARQALAEAGPDDRVRAEAAQGLAATLFYLKENLEEGVELAGLAAELAARSHDNVLQVESLCLQSLMECLVGRPEAVTTLHGVAELADLAPYGRVLSTPTLNRGVFALWTDGPEAVGLLDESRNDVVSRGDEGSAPMVLAQLALANYLDGRWVEATQIAQEASELALQTDQRPMHAYSLAIRALVRASLGLESDARADAQQALAFAGERGMAAARLHSLWALGLLELSLDRPAEAERLLAPERVRLLAAGVGEPGAIRFVPDEIEALIALGRTDEALVPLDWLEERGSALDRPSALAAAARCRGLLAAARGESDAALAELQGALGEHARLESPFERARTLLAFGAAERRAMKKAAAREKLNEALAVFEELGAAIWAEKARAELASIGGRAPASDELTPAETRVAALVAEGRTNREVAATLFVTDHTVEAHLSHIYRKLGIRSRAELARRFHAEPGKP
ncbi:MAG TPA: AAA family ATPase [Gaiellaceae bacterium]|nr:AAA family ATPase [Gaiellaceae bacterium]